MRELLASTIWYLPFVLIPVVAALLAPVLATRARVTFAVLCTVGALGLGGLAIEGSLQGPNRGSDGVIVPARRTLEVIHALPQRGATTAVHVAEEVEAPPWQWPLVPAAVLATMSTWLFVRRRRPPATPRPLPLCVGISAIVLGMRLALEKTAAPAGLVQASALAASSVPMLAVGAAYLGRRRGTFSRFALLCLLLSVAQRGVVVAWSYVATTRHLGTHLDVGAVASVNLPVFGERDFGAYPDPVEQWFWASLPQLTFWPLTTVLAGLIIGAGPFLLGRSMARHHAHLVSGTTRNR